MSTRLILFAFVTLFFSSVCVAASPRQGPPRQTLPPITSNDGLNDAMTERLQGSVAAARGGDGIPRIAERLNFLQEFFGNLKSNPLLQQHFGLTAQDDEYTLVTPPVTELSARDGELYQKWRQAHLISAALQYGQVDDLENFEQSSAWRDREKNLLLAAQRRHARQQTSEQLERDAEQGRFGTVDPTMRRILINQALLPAVMRDAEEEAFQEYGSHDIRLGQQINPSVGNVAVSLLDRGLFTPWRNFYRRHKSKIDALSQLLIIVSASAFIFNKVGGTEWVKNQIRRMFDQPTVYEVLRRKKDWMTHAKPNEVVREDDLILAPTLRKQVSELIYLLRRRYELRKKTGKRYAMTPVLLYGPPGTGKTTIARMIADQSLGDNGSPMNFIKLVASDFMQVKNEGDRVAVLKRMFAEARRMGNTVIFLDEIDGMVRQRGQGDERVNRAFLDQLLDLIERPDPDVLVVAATNHKNRMDDALRSRFRRQLEVRLPSTKQREAMIVRHARRILGSQGYKITFDAGEVAHIMQGAAGRDIETFMMRARDRLAFQGQNEASVDVAFQVLREMGFLPPLIEEEESIMPIDTEELIGI